MTDHNSNEQKSPVCTHKSNIWEYHVAIPIVWIGRLFYGLVSLPATTLRYVKLKQFKKPKRVLMFERQDASNKESEGQDTKPNEQCLITYLKEHGYQADRVSDDVEFKEKIQTERFDLVMIDYFCEYIEPKIENQKNHAEKVQQLDSKLTDLDTLIEEIRKDMGDVWCSDGHDLALEIDKIIRDIPANKRPELAIHSRFARKLVTTEEFAKLQDRNISWLWKYKDLDQSKDRNIKKARQREVRHLDRLILRGRLKRLDAGLKKLSLISLISILLTTILVLYTNNLVPNFSTHLLSIAVGVFASLLVNAISYLVSSGKR
ncbi:hypothetical protein WOB75_04425 [Vibrio parahaemolyticus]|nr:hypothetical protein [Vibrio parahaemolyticus]MCF9076946.1 hypothetical protein [Vibrio parahaemolyticus]